MYDFQHIRESSLHRELLLLQAALMLLHLHKSVCIKIGVNIHLCIDRQRHTQWCKLYSL